MSERTTLEIAEQPHPQWPEVVLARRTHGDKSQFWHCWALMDQQLGGAFQANGLASEEEEEETAAAAATEDDPNGQCDAGTTIGDIDDALDKSRFPAVTASVSAQLSVNDDKDTDGKLVAPEHHRTEGRLATLSTGVALL